MKNDPVAKVIPIGDLEVDPGNLRQHDARSDSGIEASLKRFGPARSIVVDGNGVVRAGNGTLEAARRVGITDVLVVEPKPGQLVAVRRSDWSPSEATGYAISDNRLTDLSSFDDDALAKTLRALQDEDFDLGAVGFTDAEVDALFVVGDDDGTDSDGVGETPEPRIDQAAELQAKWGTEPGQLWLIPSRTIPGREHRLLCGDSTKAEDVARLCVEEVQSAFTSPPYAEQRKEQYGGTPADRYVEWWEAVQANVRDHLASDGSFFVNIKAHCEDGQRSLYVMDLVIAMKRRFGWRYVDEFCWVREGVPGRWPNRLANGFEPIFHFSLANDIKFRPDNVAHESERTFSYSPDNRKSATGFVSPEDGDEQPGMALPRNVLRIASDKSQSGLHSAAFPVALPTFFLHGFSDPGDIWFDSFCGSGTSIVAAEQTGRIGFGTENLPAHVAVALQRLADMGLEPHLSD